MLLLIACVGVGTTVVGSGGDTGVGADSGTLDSTLDTADTADTAETGDTGLPPPCTAWGDPVQTGLVEDVELNEISGVIPSLLNPGALWVVEDHGNEAAVYALDELGVLLATVTIEGVENEDMEDLDLVPCGEATCIVVADVGNNGKDRDDLALVVFEEPKLDGVTLSFSVVADRYRFTFPGVEDSESLTHTNDGRFVIATKRTDKTTGVYTIPAFTDDAVASLIGELVTADEDDEGAGGLVTSASMWPDQSRLLLRTYQYAREWTLPDGVDTIGTATYTDIEAPVMPHVEAVGYDTVRLGYWTIPEAPLDATSPVWWVPCTM
ncbi:hypothetical protein LBMAG42_16340 [Deltaproteobacteria bacterium]|nr:hypothetical protein LBMAG42_16340 [Deltaproteobacteria bacterium]